MQGISKTDVNGVDNPVLQFVYQAGGVLADVAELSYTITGPTGTTVVTSTAVDVVTERIAIGRFAPSFTVSSAWAVGTYRILWKYKVLGTENDYSYKTDQFEVLDPDIFSFRQEFHTYVPSKLLKANNVFTNISVGMVQLAAYDASAFVDSYTQRFFEPRYIEHKIDGVESVSIVLQQPIIGLESIEVFDSENELIEAIALTDVRIYNRHLAKMTDPDDRQHPKIDLVTSTLVPGSLRYRWPEGHQNIVIRGVFGYTDPDNTPTGQTPSLLSRAASLLAYKYAVDPLGIDKSVWQPNTIVEAETRDQKVKFATSTSSSTTSGGSSNSPTNDTAIDNILIKYARPPHFASVL